VAGTRLQEIRNAILSGDWSVLPAAIEAPPGLGAWGRLDLNTCPSCPNTNTLTLRSITTTQDKKGKVETKETVLLDRALLSSEEVESLLAIRAQAEAAAPISPDDGVGSPAEGEAATEPVAPGPGTSSSTSTT
jgi:hypothetical protein